MLSLTVKEIKQIDRNHWSRWYNQFTNKVWYDWFGERETLGGKFLKYVLPIIKKLPSDYDNYYVWAKESIPLYNKHNFCYHIFVTTDEEKPSRVHFVHNIDSITMYKYDTEDTNKKILEQTFSSIKQLVVPSD